MPKKSTKKKKTSKKIKSDVIRCCFKCESTDIEFFKSGPKKKSYNCKDCGWRSCP